MLGTFSIEAVMPLWNPGDVLDDLKWAVQTKPVAEIEIVFEEGTDVPAAVKDLYDALTKLGLTG
jgi:hypothetical protein